MMKWLQKCARKSTQRANSNNWRTTPFKVHENELIRLIYHVYRVLFGVWCLSIHILSQTFLTLQIVYGWFSEKKSSKWQSWGKNWCEHNSANDQRLVKNHHFYCLTIELKYPQLVIHKWFLSGEWKVTSRESQVNREKRTRLFLPIPYHHQLIINYRRLTTTTMRRNNDTKCFTTFISCENCMFDWAYNI